MVMDTKWKRVSDWIVPIWKRGAVNPHFHTGIPTWNSRAGTFQSQYGNGD